MAKLIAKGIVETDSHNVNDIQCVLSGVGKENKTSNHSERRAVSVARQIVLQQPTNTLVPPLLRAVQSELALRQGESAIQAVA